MDYTFSIGFKSDLFGGYGSTSVLYFSKILTLLSTIDFVLMVPVDDIDRSRVLVGFER